MTPESSNQKNIRQTLRELFDNWNWILSFTHGYRTGIICFCVLGIFSSLFSLVTALISKQLIDALSALDSPQLVMYILLLLLAGAASIGFTSLSSRISARLQIGIQHQIHRHCFDALLRSRWQEILKYPTGDLINRFSSDVNTVGSCAFGLLPKVLIHGFTALASLAAVAWFDPIMALIFCASIPVLVLSSHKFIRKIQHHNRKMRGLSSELTAFESEAVRNFDTLKSFEAEPILRRRLDDQLDKLSEASLEHNLFTIQTNLWMNALASLLQYLTLGYCLWRLWAGQLQWGTLVLFLQQHGTLSAAFSALIGLVPAALSGGVAAERLRELTGLEKETFGQCPALTSCSVHADHVSCGYKNKPLVLRDICLTVTPGETLALTGQSGEGKTTLLRLLLALITPSGGTLFLKDEKGTVHPVSPATRSCFTYVPQGNTMMAASVADNLRLGSPDASDEEMIQALKDACAWEFIEPLGLNTWVSEGGKGFSQGQAQRLAIARALLRKAPILLLDEATSDLDPQTESRVLRNLSRLGKTCILTTHRTTVSEQCDHIIRIQSGKLIQIK